MKEITATAMNVIGVPLKDKTFEARCELILISSEPIYRVDVSGRLVKERGALETTRLVVSPEGLESLADQLREYAEEARAYSPPVGEAEDGK